LRHELQPKLPETAFEIHTLTSRVQRGQVVWLVIRDALGLLALGVILGLPAAWAASRSVASMLLGLTASDPSTIFFAVALLIAVGFPAGYLPARGASRVDPMAALRCD
jgi:ABC-type antimicrobial peptide transport system permease subunit